MRSERLKEDLSWANRYTKGHDAIRPGIPKSVIARP